MSDHVTADLKFSIVPEWVLDAPISDKALRLYCVLARYADNDDLTAYPGRGTLAKRVGCHRATIDRAVEELITLGAITKQVRVKDGKYQSSLYTIRRVAPSRTHATTPVAPMLPPPSHPCDIELEPENVEPKNYSSTNNRKTRMSDSWSPDPDNLDRLKEKHRTLDVDREVENFRDYWISKGDTRADWNAGFRSWMRKAEEYAAKRGAQPSSPEFPAGAGGVYA